MMNTRDTETGQSVLVKPFTLWHRRGTRAKWVAVATAETRIAALDLVGVGGRNGGDWLVLPTGTSPGGPR